MKTQARTLSVLFIITLIAVSCGKDKASSPSRPEDQGLAITMSYQNYFYQNGSYWGCIRLALDDNNLDMCYLGTRSISLWTRDYEWKLYVIDTRNQPETYRLVRQGTVRLDRNRTFVVNGNSVSWE